MKIKNVFTSKIFSFLFGTVFLLAGLGAAYMTFGKMTYLYLTSEKWQPVPAKIVSLDLKVNNGDSTTYSVDAIYTYDFQNEPYQSDQVSFSTGSDNIGDYWQDLHRRLERNRSNNTAVALVNPNDPGESVLDRTFRWPQVAFGSMFVLMFGGFGAAAIWFSIKGFKSKADVVELAKENGIYSDEKSGFWIIFCFGSVFFLMGGFTFAMVLPEIINDGEYAALFTLLFVLVGAGIMAFALRNRRRYKLIGPTPLFLDPLPGAIGGQVGATFDVACMSMDEPIDVKLTCQRRVKSGKNTHIKIIWQDAMQAYATQTSKGMNVQFLFDCPADLPEEGDNGVEWEVKAQGQLKVKSNDVKFTRTWSIPVFNSTTSSAQSTITIPARFLAEQDQARQQAAKASADSFVQLKQQGRHLNVESIAGRPIFSSLIGVLFGAVFAGIGVFTILDNWWPGYVFVVIGVLAVFGAIFVLGRELDVKIDTQTRLLHMRRKWFGIVLYKREVMLLEPTQFSLKKTSSASSGSNLTEYYAVNIDNNGKKVLLAEGIKSKAVARAVMDGIIEQAFPSRF